MTMFGSLVVVAVVVVTVVVVVATHCGGRCDHSPLALHTDTTAPSRWKPSLQSNTRTDPTRVPLPWIWPLLGSELCGQV